MTYVDLWSHTFIIHSNAQVRKTEVTKGFQQMLLIGVLWASYVAKNLELYSVVHL